MSAICNVGKPRRSRRFLLAPQTAYGGLSLAIRVLWYQGAGWDPILQLSATVKGDKGYSRTSIGWSALRLPPAHRGGRTILQSGSALIKSGDRNRNRQRAPPPPDEKLVNEAETSINRMAEVKESSC